MRNATIHNLTQRDSLIITSDNSGGIGMKEMDVLKVPYETLSYFSFRVSVMECLSTGGKPILIVLQNFCGDENWNELVEGVQRGLNELKLQKVPITGSSESNFPLVQSATGIIVIGQSSTPKQEIPRKKELKWATIGKPLVGEDVLEQPNMIVPLETFNELNNFNDVHLWPVGSKGILFELNKIFHNRLAHVECSVDVHSSAGPSTCSLIAYPIEVEDQVKSIAGDLFHPLLFNSNHKGTTTDPII